MMKRLKVSVECRVNVCYQESMFSFEVVMMISGVVFFVSVFRT